jgi:hypothetical protein
MTEVRLGETAEGSISAAVYALVERAVHQQPEIAAELTGHIVRLEFDEGWPPIRIEFYGDVIEVGDCGGHEADAVIRGALPDVTAVLTAPLTAGVPNPIKAQGRAALARLADGRVRTEGSRAVARRVLQLLAIDRA